MALLNDVPKLSVKERHVGVRLPFSSARFGRGARGDGRILVSFELPLSLVPCTFSV